MEVQTWATDKIIIGERIRQDLGDLEDLKRSMTERGLIHPVTVKTDGTLLTGERRLRAAQQLGWDGVAVRVWQPADDADALAIEAEENLCRKDLSPAEADLYAERLEALLKPEAEEAQREGGREGGRGGKTAGQNKLSQNLAKLADPHARRTARKAAKATGYSAETLKKVREVRKAAEDETEPEEVREEAQRQYKELMKPGAKVAPAHAKVRDKKRRQPKLKTDLLPGQWIAPPPPPKPVPDLAARLVDGISKGQGLAALAAEIQTIDLDLGVETIVALRRRLREEIKERRQLDTALKGVLDNRKDRP